MKLNHVILSLSIAIVIVWIMMRYNNEQYETSDKDALDNYIIDQEKLDPTVVKEMASKLTSDMEILDKFHDLASRDDRLGLFKLTAEF